MAASEEAELTAAPGADSDDEHAQAAAAVRIQSQARRRAAAKRVDELKVTRHADVIAAVAVCRWCWDGRCCDSCCAECSVLFSHDGEVEEGRSVCGGGGCLQRCCVHQRV